MDRLHQGAERFEHLICVELDRSDLDNLINPRLKPGRFDIDCDVDLVHNAPLPADAPTGETL
jgi:hypothetical protein